MSDKKPWYSGEVSGAMEDFIALESAYRIDSLVSALHRALDNDARTTTRRISGPEWTVMAVNTLEECVNMDGYASFFTNHAVFKTTILDALTQIGEKLCAELTRSAMNLAGVASLLEGRTDRLDAETLTALNEIDSRYFEQRIAMCDAIWSHVKANKHAFTLQKMTVQQRKPFSGLLDWLAGIFKTRKR